MSRRNVRDAWTVEVLRSSEIGDACRVMLLAMAQQMTEGGAVSVKRGDLAAILDRHPQRIAERIAEAREAGLLDLVGGGYRGHPAEYAALISTPGKRTGERYAIAGKRTGERYVKSVRNPRSADTDSERAPIREGSASVSERLAVNKDREPRTEHDGTRDEPDHDDTSSSNEKMRCTRPPVAAAVDPDPARTRHPNPDDPHGGGGSVTRARDAEDPRSLTRPLAGAALCRWEPTRPIGPIVVYGVTYGAGRRVREAAVA